MSFLIFQISTLRSADVSSVMMIKITHTSAGGNTKLSQPLELLQRRSPSADTEYRNLLVLLLFQFPRQYTSWSLLLPVHRLAAGASGMGTSPLQSGNDRNGDVKRAELN